MKTLLALAFVALFVPCFAADPIDVSAAPVVDLISAMNGAAGFDGQIVKVTFGWREGDMLISTNGKAKGKGQQKGGLRVSVPDAGKAWFSSLPTQPTLASSQSAYLKIHSRAVSEVVGRSIKDGQPEW